MKTRQFVDELRSAGCYRVRKGGNLDVWFSPITGLKDAVPRHDSKELGRGLERWLRQRLLGQ